jgi:hypothetical protein
MSKTTTLGLVKPTHGINEVEGNTAGVPNEAVNLDLIDAAIAALNGAPQGMFVVTSPAAGQIIAKSLLAASQATLRLIDSELTLGYQGSTTVSGSVASLRGNTTIDTGTTITGASYVYGTQGKLTIKGTHSGSAEVSCGLLGQLDLSAATAATAPIAAIWADCGASMSGGMGAAAANIDAVVAYNTTGTKINAAFRVDTNSTYFMDLSDEGGGHGAGNWIIGTAKGSGWTKSLKIKLPDATYYIPCNPAAS